MKSLRFFYAFLDFDVFYWFTSFTIRNQMLTFTADKKEYHETD